MQKFYEVLGLKPGLHLFEKAGLLEIFLTDELLKSVIFDDKEVLKAKAKGQYIWVSGGGTYLINNQYVLLVKRPETALINPGKYSIFSGRANDKNELIKPALLIRELFEELLLYDNNYLIYPINEEYQKLIDQVYIDIINIKSNIPIKKIEIKSYDLLKNNLKINYRDRIAEYLIPYHINKFGEINILFLFSTNLDIENLFAQDGEIFNLDRKMTQQNREIYLYDLRSSMAKNITINSDELGKLCHLDESLMSDHLAYMIEMIKKILVPIS